MKVLFYLGHPAHYHLFKNVILKLKKNGQQTTIVAKKKDVLENLLELTGWKYINILPKGRRDNFFSIALAFGRREFSLFKVASEVNPEIMIGTSAEITHVGKLKGIPTVVVNEDDHDAVPLFAKLAYPFATEIMAPSSCRDGKFYESNPFGARDWSNPAEVEEGVENDIKDLLKNISKQALIIDVGAGTGRVSNYLGMHGFQNVVSLDYSLTSLKQVEKNSNNLCVWGNNLRIPVASNSFDLVISTGVIHHTPDPARALSECARIVKPGGRFYLRVRNIHSPYGYLFYTYGSALRFFEKASGSEVPV